jgi:hypothetical protein
MKSLARYGFTLICAGLAFVLVCSGISKLCPKQVSGISLKVRRFTSQKKNVDIIFIGSSRIVKPEWMQVTRPPAGDELVR